MIWVQDSLGGMPHDDERWQHVPEPSRLDAEPLVGDAHTSEDLTFPRAQTAGITAAVPASS